MALSMPNEPQTPNCNLKNALVPSVFLWPTQVVNPVISRYFAGFFLKRTEQILYYKVQP